MVTEDGVEVAEDELDERRFCRSPGRPPVVPAAPRRRRRPRGRGGAAAARAGCDRLREPSSPTARAAALASSAISRMILESSSNRSSPCLFHVDLPVITCVRSVVSTTLNCPPFSLGDLRQHVLAHLAVARGASGEKNAIVLIARCLVGVELADLGEDRVVVVELAVGQQVDELRLLREGQLAGSGAGRCCRDVMSLRTGTPCCLLSGLATTRLPWRTASARAFLEEDRC